MKRGWAVLWIVLGLAAVCSWAVFADALPNAVVWALVVGVVIAVATS